MSFLTNRLTLTILLLISSICLLALGLRPALGQSGTDELRAVDEVYGLVRERFREETDATELRDAAINGMLELLDDPYTNFIPARDLVEFDKDVRGEYVGIGAEVDASEGYLRIASPMDGSPAWNAGLEPDDLVVGVDGTSTFQLGLTGIIDMLLGDPNTEVVVTIERTGDKNDWPADARPATKLVAPEPAEGEEMADVAVPVAKAGRTRFDLTLVRKPIRTITVKGLYREGEDWRYYADREDKVAYVRLTQFTDSTPITLDRTIRPLVADGMNGLILDLRYNTGGSLLAAIQVADLFLERGVIVSTKGRNGPSQYARAGRTRRELPNFPMIVLVNSGSASASEIVAGALKDNDRAVILGDRSFGKGSVQSVIPLASGQGSLKITEQYYYLPSGKLLHRTDEATDWGVDPDDGFYVPMDPEDSIAMWRERRAAETLRNEALDGDWDDPAWVLEHLKDPQLAAAIGALHAKIVDGEWVQPGETIGAGSIELAALRLEEERRELFLDELARIDQRIAALERASANGEEPEVIDLIPDEATLTDGRIEVYDAEGRVVATLSITDENLEFFLTRAPVKPADRSAQGDAIEGEPDPG